MSLILLRRNQLILSSTNRLGTVEELATDTSECSDAISAALRNLVDVGISLEKLEFARQNRASLAYLQNYSLGIKGQEYQCPL